MSKISGFQINFEKPFIVKPCTPKIPGIFDISGETTICAHAPHTHIKEHLHDHFYHMHIRYGLHFPKQSLDGIGGAAALEVVMLIKSEHRVDCNPIFVALAPNSGGVCLKIDGQDVHWVHNQDAADKATAFFLANGYTLPTGFYFSGFRTSDVDERNVRRYSREELLGAIGNGLFADQHFQATWKEPKDIPIEPYDVVIFLSDDATNYYTFFELKVIPPLGSF